jgi:hypothetical protein
MGVTGQIFQYVFSAFDRFTYADHPVFGKKSALKLAVPVGVEHKRFVGTSLANQLHEPGTKDLR